MTCSKAVGPYVGGGNSKRDPKMRLFNPKMRLSDLKMGFGAGKGRFGP